MKASLKTWIAVVAVVLGLAIPIVPMGSVYGKDPMKKLGKDVKKLDTEESSILLVVGPMQKITNEKEFLKTVKKIMAPSQTEIFTLPLATSKLQHMPVVKIDVSGNVIDNLDVGNVIPAGKQGIANTIMIYEGDTTLPAQVLANLGKVD